ncbi:MAG: hypothetical protein WCJ84_06145 [Candidatus Peregrinibacteria bacterium]
MSPPESIQKSPDGNTIGIEIHSGETVSSAYLRLLQEQRRSLEQKTKINLPQNHQSLTFIPQEARPNINQVNPGDILAVQNGKLTVYPHEKNLSSLQREVLKNNIGVPLSPLSQPPSAVDYNHPGAPSNKIRQLELDTKFPSARETPYIALPYVSQNEEFWTKEMPVRVKQKMEKAKGRYNSSALCSRYISEVLMQFSGNPLSFGGNAWDKEKFLEKEKLGTVTYQNPLSIGNNVSHILESYKMASVSEDAEEREKFLEAVELENEHSLRLIGLHFAHTHASGNIQGSFHKKPEMVIPHSHLITTVPIHELSYAAEGKDESVQSVLQKNIAMSIGMTPF